METIMAISINFLTSPLSNCDHPPSAEIPTMTRAGTNTPKDSLRAAHGLTLYVPPEASAGFIEPEVRTPNLDVKTIADALQFVEQHNLMSAKALTAAASAVAVVATVLGRPVDQVPAAPEQLTPLLKAAAPARHAVWGKQWSSAMFFTRALLKACGLHRPIAGGKRPSDPAWAAIIGALPKKRNDGGKHEALAGFGSWCSGTNISPEHVTEQVPHDYLHDCETQTIILSLVALRSTIRQGWNQALRAHSTSWPGQFLVPPPQTRIDALPALDFPPSLIADIDEYLVKRIRPDSVDENHPPWRVATAKEARYFLIRAASLVARRLGGTEHVRSLADIVTAENYEFILRQQHERMGNTWRGYSMNFASCLLMVARDFVKVDPRTLIKIKHLHDVITKYVSERRRPGLSDRVNRQLMPFQDPRIVKRLFELPDLLYRSVAHSFEDEIGVAPSHKAKRGIVRPAQLHEKALMLDLLQHDPMRRYNLAAINLETDFVRDEHGCIKRLSIARGPTRNGVAIDIPIPPALAEHIAEHLSDHRPHLRGAGSPWLFPSPTGGYRAPHNITNAITQVVRKNIGVTCSPILIRHIIAMQLYRQNPANSLIVQRMLRHSRVETTEEIYGNLGSASASAAWQAELAQYRHAAIGARVPETESRTKRPRPVV
jgi:integrase